MIIKVFARKYKIENILDNVINRLESHHTFIIITKNIKFTTIKLQQNYVSEARESERTL